MNIIRTTIICTFLFFSLAAGAQSSPQYMAWSAGIGGPSVDYGNSVAVDGTGNVLTTGSFSDSIDVDPGPALYQLFSNGGVDIYLLKHDKTGNLLWGVSFGDIEDDYDNAVTTDASGNIYVTGSFTGTIDADPGPGVFTLASQGTDVFILKLDTNGNFLWAVNVGGYNNDTPQAIATDVAGNVYITGTFQSGDCDMDPGPGIYYLSTMGQFDEFILKLDTNGNFLWARQRVSATNCFSAGYALDVDASGNVYTTGAFNGTVDFDNGPGVVNLIAQDFMDGYMSKLDANGDFVWAKQVSSCNGIDYAKAIILDAAGNIYTAGIFENTCDFDPGPGNINVTAAGSSDIYISKFNTGGNLVWTKTMGGVSYEYLYSIALNAAGNIYTTGYFNGAADLDPGPGVYTVNSPLGYETFISVLNNNGDFVQAYALNGNENNAGYAIASDACENIYVTGSFSGTADFEPGSGIFSLTAVNTDSYILKLSQSYWTGNVSTDWHNPLNWACNTIPGVQSNVIIPSTAPRFPILLTNAEVRSMVLMPGAGMQVSAGVLFKVNGHNN